MRLGNWKFDGEQLDTIEVGYRGRRVAELNRLRLDLKLCLFEDHISIDLLGSFFNIGRAWRAPRDGPIESWGVGIHEDYLHLNWGDKSKLIRLPIVSWQHDDSLHLVLADKGGWVLYDHKPGKEAKDGRRTWVSPYRYKRRCGKVQEVEATYYLEQRTWRRWWAPFLKKTHYSIVVKFSGEVGEKAGSWKGGCIGCGYEIDLSKETPTDCLHRMERERTFS